MRARLGRRGFVIVGVIAAFMAVSSALALTVIRVHIFGDGPGNADVDVDISVDVPQLDPLANVLSQLQYEIHTRGGPGCNTSRVVKTAFGVPTPVNVDTNIVPDITVTVIPIPAGGVTTVQMNVTKLATGALPARVQAVLAPGGSATADRVAFGYDGCGSASPRQFGTRIISAPTRLSLATEPSGAGAHLTILGAAYKQNGTTIVDPTQVAAKFEPVPSELNAVVDILANSTYKAHVDTDVASKLGFAYLNRSGAKRTDVNAGIVKLPETVDLTLTGSSVAYTTSAPIDAAAIDVTSTETGERTTQVSADLGDLPTTASFVRDGENHATFTTPGELGQAIVRFASFEPGTSLPAAPTNTNQFFSAAIADSFDVADLRLTGVKTLSGGWGDDFDLDLVHDAGPFDIDVLTETQTVDASIRDLPADIALGYTKALGAFTYDGSDDIGQITVDILSTEPFGDTRADEVHVIVSDIPQHMNATLDHTGKTFTADMDGDQLGEIEVLVTNGPADRIADEVDGLVFTDPSVKPRAPKPGQPPIDPPIDPSTPYEAFVRVSELEEVTVSWGETQAVHVLHDEQPFKLDVELAERSGVADIDRVDVVGTLTSLPHDVGFTYTPGKLFTYDSDTQMDTLDITVQRSRPTQLISKLGVHAELLPTHLDITFDEPNRGVTATVEGLPLHLLEVSQRNTDQPESLLGPDEVGVSRIEKIEFDGDERNNAFVRLKEITGASVSMGPKEADAPVSVSLHHAGGEFHIRGDQDGFGPEIPIFKNTRTLHVLIPNLPQDINSLSYAPRTKELHFNGGAGIDRLDVDLENTVEPLAGDIEGPYAKRLELRVIGVPAVVDLVPTFTKTSDDDQVIAMELGAGQFIGAVDILLTSLPEDRLPSGKDGLLLETLNDRYVIHGHVSGLSSFRYESSKVHIEETDPKFDRRTFKYDHSNKHVHLLRSSRAPLRVDVRKFDEEKDDVAYITTEVADAPEEITLDLNRDKRTDVDEEGNKDFRTYGTYNSSSPGGVFTFDTNEGKVNRTNLNATIDPMPKDATFCLSTAWAICSPARKDPADHRSELSVVLEVSSPVHLDVTDTLYWPGGVCGPNGLTCPPGDRDVLTVAMDIEKRLAAHHQEHEVTGVNNHFIYLDTARGYLTGSVRTYNFPFTSRDIIINFPAGPHPGEAFRTDARDVYFVIHTNGSYDAERISGLASCTAGVDIAKETGIIGIGVVDLDEGFCSAPETIAALNADGSPASVARGAVDQAVYLIDSPEHAYSPGAGVAVTEMVNGVPFPVDGVRVTDVFWEDFDRLRILVTVDDDAEPDTYDIFVVNQSGGGDHICGDCITIT